MKSLNKWLLIGVGVVGLIILIWLISFGSIFGTRNQNYLQGDQANKEENTSQVGSKMTQQNCVADECLQVDDLEYPIGELAETAKIALEKAIEDEYKARALYQKVIDKYGNIRPFIMIIRAEEQHISSLKALFDKYGLSIPADNTQNLPEIISVSGACTIGVEAEIANADLYQKELLPDVKNYEDITLVFTSLMDASLKNHLPAFQKCAE